jgi:arylformamidase
MFEGMGKKRTYIDIAVPIRSGMAHWPGDPEVVVERTESIAQGDEYNVSHISLGSHTGTHVDAPCHYFRDAACIDSIPLDALIGHARVLHIEDSESVKPEALALYDIGAGDRILLKTRNSRRDWADDDFREDFVYISHEAARYLVRMGVRTVGIDYLSVGGYYKDGRETHRTLLAAGIWIIEGLNLSKAEPGRYELICLPLKIANGDGAPARAILYPT